MCKSFKVLAITRATRIFFLALLLAVGIGSASADSNVVNIFPFDKISAKGGVKINYRCVADSAGLAVVESARGAKDVELNIKKGELSVKPVRESDFSEWPEVTVYSAYLTGVSSEDNAHISAQLSTIVPEFSANVTGNGKITVGNLDCTSARASLSTGSGKIIMSGRCINATYTLVGTGSIEASALQAETVKCNVTGTGSIGCDASETLDVRGLGSTRIFYKGQPDIRKTGAAKIFPLSSETWEETQN